MTDARSTGLIALIVDDEQPARRRLRRLLQPLVSEGRVHIVGEAADGVEALDQLNAHDVDVLFLDVQMPELNGFGVIERIDPERRPAVIFTTAYDAYAVRAFDANAVDYLLKPIGRERLDEAVSRVERLRKQAGGRGARLGDEKVDQLLDWIEHHSDQLASDDDDERDARSTHGKHLRQISIPYRDRILIVPVTRLISAEINEGITRLVVVKDENSSDPPQLRHHVVNYTLDQLESNLDPSDFMRVHRSAIVQLRHVRELVPWFSGRYKLILTGDHEVIASRDRSKQLKEELML